MTAYAYSRPEYDARRSPAEPFEWEELPSLGDVVLRRHVAAGSYTIAADLMEKATERFRSGPPFAPV